MIRSFIAYVIAIGFLRKIFEPVERSLTYNVRGLLSHASKAMIRGKAQDKSLGLNKEFLTGWSSIRIKFIPYCRMP